MVGAFCHLIDLYPHSAEIAIEDPLTVKVERCHPDKTQPHGDQRHQQQYSHHAVKQHYAGPTAYKELERDQNGLRWRQATFQHQRYGEHQPHADQGRGNKGQHRWQSHQIEQGPEQAGQGAAQQAQHAKTHKMAEKVEHLIRPGPNPDRLLQSQHIEGAGHGGHDHGDKEA